MNKQTRVFATLCILLLQTSIAVAIADLPSVGFQVEIYAEVTDPNGIAIADDGTIYTGRHDINAPSGGGALKIHRIGVGGTPVDEYGNATIFDPDVVAVDELGLVSGVPGTVLVGGNSVGFNGSPVGGSLITAIRPDETVSTLIHVGGPVGQDINGLAFDSMGKLFFSTDNGVYSATSSIPTLFVPRQGAPRPGGIDIDANDNLYIRWEDSVVRKYDSTGSLLPFSFSTQGNIAISAGGPFGEDNIYTIEEGELRFVDATGSKFTLGSGFGNNGNNPAFGPDGDLFVTQLSEDRVLRIFAPQVPEPTTLSMLLVSGVLVALPMRHRRFSSV